MSGPKYLKAKLYGIKRVFERFSGREWAFFNLSPFMSRLSLPQQWPQGPDQGIHSGARERLMASVNDRLDALLRIGVQRRRFRIRYRTPSKKTTIEILLMPCIILMLMFEGRDGSFLRKKYPPTSPREKNCFQPPFFRVFSV